MGALSKLREQIADALEGIALDGTDVAIHREVAEAIEPPCYLLSWGNPMLEPMTGCTHTVRPAVVCVGGRLNAPDGQGVTEDLLEAALPRLRPLMALDAGEQLVMLEVSGIVYLSSRIVLRTTVSI